jgi:hypothetical protein
MRDLQEGETERERERERERGMERVLMDLGLGFCLGEEDEV